jgi:hypothetical protein
MSWLPDMDLNHDKQIQSLLCYRYTIGQTRAVKVEVPRRESRCQKRDKWAGGAITRWRSELPVATARLLSQPPIRQFPRQLPVGRPLDH